MSNGESHLNASQLTDSSQSFDLFGSFLKQFEMLSMHHGRRYTRHVQPLRPLLYELERGNHLPF